MIGNSTCLVLDINSGQFRWQWSLLAKPNVAFLDVAGIPSLLLSSSKQFVVQPLSESTTNTLQTLPVTDYQINNDIFADLGVVAVGGTSNESVLIDLISRRTVFPLFKTWEGSPYGYWNKDLRILSSQSPALPQPHDGATLTLPQVEVDISILRKLGQLLSMASVSEKLDVTRLTSTEATTLWNELRGKHPVLKPADKDLARRWWMLDDIEYAYEDSVAERLPTLQAIARTEGEWFDHSRLGISLCRLQQYDEALKSLAKVRDEDDIGARCWEVVALVRLNKLDEAVKTLERIRAHDPPPSPLDQSMAEGVYADAMGDPDKAIQWFQKASDWDLVRDQLVDVAAKAGKNEIAFGATGNRRRIDTSFEQNCQLAILSLAVGNQPTFKRACDDLLNIVGKRGDPPSLRQAIEVLTTAPSDKKRTAWTEQALKRLDLLTDTSSADLYTTALVSEFPVAFASELEEFAILQAQVSRPGYGQLEICAARIVQFLATRPRFDLDDLNIALLEESLVAALTKARDMSSEERLKQLTWQDRVIFNYLLDTAVTTYAFSVREHVARLSDKGQWQAAETLVSDVSSGKFPELKQEMLELLQQIRAKQADRNKVP